MTAPSAPVRRIGPITLAPGVLPSQVGVFTFVVVCALCVVTFLPMMQAYVFTELLKVPKAEHGKLAGNLVTTQQLAVLFFVGITGALADRIGRKAVLCIAIAGYVVCMAAYPMAGSVAMLFVLQFLFGLMTTGHITGTSTMIADFPDNASRGKLVAAMLLLQAAVSALLVGYVGARLPSWLVAGGASQADAGRWAFWAVGALAALALAVALLFLREPPRSGVSAHGPSAPRGFAGFLAGLKAVLAHGRRNPRFGLVMTMGLVIRSDYFVMLSFVSLWVVNAATGAGIASSEALKTAGLLMLTFKLATAGAQAVFGFVADKVDRSKLLVASLFATGLSLCATALVHDVFGLAMFVVVAIIGITESALIVCGQAMLGQESPPELRGAATGIFYFCGTLGVVIMSFIAGRLFDQIGYAAPFVMVGLLNLVFAVLGAFLVLRGRSPALEVGHAR